jgi:hypothetical protein
MSPRRSERPWPCCHSEPRKQRQAGSDRGILQCSHSLTSFVRSFAALRMTEIKMGTSMRGGALVDGSVLRHLVIFHQAEAPIDQGLFVFVG